MSFRQTAYSQQLGAGPYSITDAGCFLTAFSNLLERFGEPVDPPTLNDYFIRNSIYIDVDDGYRDDLDWGKIAAYDSSISVNGIGGAGWPTTNNAIVKFKYTSPRSKLLVTHFCLVADHNAGTIVDSWDGVTKVSPYGTPVAWASYARLKPQPVTPPPAPEAPSFTIEGIPEVNKQLKVDTKLWDLTKRSWPDMVNNPISSHPINHTFTTSQIAHHVLGGSYYIPNGDVNRGFNIVDCQDVAVAPVTPPAPTTYTENVVDGITFTAFDGAPKPMYVNRVGGAEKWSFQGVTNWRQFKSVEHVPFGTEVFIVGQARHPIPPNGALYYMTDADFGDFRKTGRVVNQYGFNRVDLSEERPQVVPSLPNEKAGVTAVEVPVPIETPVPKIEPAPVPRSWKDDYNKFPKPLRCIATRDLMVRDIDDDAQPSLPLQRYDASSGTKIGIVSAVGTIKKDGIEYYRLQPVTDTAMKHWYCVPKMDAATRTPNLLVVPVAAPKPATNRATVVRDNMALARAHIEFDVPKFLDDIIPKFLKNKK